MLVLHGGPGASQSTYAYEYQKDWSEKYTVVTWDQRGCGLSDDTGLESKDITFDLMLSDSLVIIDFVRDYMEVEKIDILGYSWGTMLGARLAYEYPQYLNSFIAAGQVVDTYQNEVEFVKEATVWAKDDPEGLEMVNALTPDSLNSEHYILKSQIMARYGYSAHGDGYGFNYYKALFFNPYYSISDIYNYIMSNDESLYLDFINSDEFNKFSLTNQLEYTIPYYLICGEDDYQTNANIAKSYFEQIKAPKKDYFVIKDCAHGLMEVKTKEFTEILMKIE